MSASTDALIPNSPKAERGVLGSILINHTLFTAVKDKLKAEDFYTEANAEVFRAMDRLHEKGMTAAIDPFMLKTELQSMGKTETVGGMPYLLQLLIDTPSTLGVDGYAQLVAELSYRRRLIDFAQLVARQAHSDSASLLTIHDTITRELNKLGGHSVRSYQPAGAFFGEFLDQIAERVRAAEGGKPDVGWQTGLSEWDHIFGGDFRPGTYSLIYGLTGVGKSWAALQMAIHAASQGPVVYFSLENTADSIRNRMVAIKSGVPTTFIREGRLTSEQLQRVTLAASDLSKLPIEVVTHLSSPDEIESHLKTATLRHGEVGIAFVDTLNELADGKGTGKRYEDLTKASGRLLRAMRSTEWGVLAIGQMRNDLHAGMNRDHARKAAHPAKANLEGARTISQHVANMIGMYSADYVAREINDPHYKDPDCPAGEVLFVNVKARDTKGKTWATVNWNVGVPRYETKKTPLALLKTA